MAKYDMCEALYALPGGVIAERRRSVAVPLLLTVAGAAMLVVNEFVGGSSDYSNLKSALLLFGATLVIAGGIVTAVRLFGGSGIPYHTGEGCYLVRKELRFGKDKAAEVADAVRRGDFDALGAIPEAGVSAITAVLYTSKSGGFKAGQAFEYVELEVRPLCDMKVVSDK